MNLYQRQLPRKVVALPMPAKPPPMRPVDAAQMRKDVLSRMRVYRQPVIYFGGNPDD